jgi:hypothetical protein
MATINTSQLTNTNISDTYLGVLHARGVPLSATGQTKIHDGSGEVSALALGRQNNGVSVTGVLSGSSIVKGNSLVANELTMPRIDTLNNNDIVIRSGTGTLALSGFSNVFNSVFSSYPDGVYVNPKITVANGLITNIESSPSVVLLTTPITLFDYQNNPTINYLLNTYSTHTIPGVFNWSANNTANPPPRYAIIKTKLVMESRAADFQVTATLDGKEIAYGRVREDRNDLGVDTMVDTNTQFFILTGSPTLVSSNFLMTLQKLDGSTQGNYNEARLTVTLDGWVY